MSDNSSLDDFARGGTDGEPDASPPESDHDGVAEPTPAVSTYQWKPQGAACERCGEAAARRWRLDDDLVCSACKTW